MPTSSILDLSASTTWWGAIFPETTSFTSILWHFTESSLLHVGIDFTIYHPKFVLHAYGPPLILKIISIGSNAFLQFALISIPTSILPTWVIPLEICFRYSYILILSDVAISSLSSGKQFFEYPLETLSFPLVFLFGINCRYDQSINYFSVPWSFSLNVSRLSFSFLPDIPRYSMISSLKNFCDQTRQAPHTCLSLQSQVFFLLMHILLYL